jgi:energy-converting hydrogenase Eha subunit G
MTRSILRTTATLVGIVAVVYGCDKLGFTDDIVKFVDYIFAYRP